MPTEAIPYPNAKNLFDILTDDQKKALMRMESERVLEHLEAGKPEQVKAEDWPKIMRANLPRVKIGLDNNHYAGEWVARAAAFVEANQQYLTPPTPAE
jgi:hypothetical protein